MELSLHQIFFSYTITAHAPSEAEPGRARRAVDRYCKIIIIIIFYKCIAM